MAPSAEEKILKECIESVVFVELKPKCVKGVNTLWNSVDPIPGKGAAAATARKSRLELCKVSLRETGFFIHEDQSYTYVLSCAHMLCNLFNRELPISASIVQKLYSCTIICDHMEQAFLKEKDTNADLKRDSIPAEMFAVNCKMDLVILRISKEHFLKKCKHSHPVIRLDDNPIVPLAKVLMISWPDQNERTVVCGRISHIGRAYSAVSEENKWGYEMRLTEVDITSDFGTSGAPLISVSTGRCVGVMQSGNVTFSYFITLDDLRKTLTEWGMMV